MKTLNQNEVIPAYFINQETGDLGTILVTVVPVRNSEFVYVTHPEGWTMIQPAAYLTLDGARKWVDPLVAGFKVTAYPLPDTCVEIIRRSYPTNIVDLTALLNGWQTS